MNIRRYKADDPALEGIIAAGSGTAHVPAHVDTSVAAIIAAVRARGDDALLEYTGQFDGHRPADAAELEVSRAELDAARANLTAGQRADLEHAAERIRAFHALQSHDSWVHTDAEGVEFGERVTPIERVGLYVPGGQAAYPSSVLMNAIPARVAGVGELIMTVPAPGGKHNPLVLAAAAIVGVDRVFAVGGAQAIAALAYGTATIPQVDKIVGPGNVYVAAAKRQVYGTVGIDMLAGPSEVLVICDATADPEWVAMDLYAQAEHDPDARATLICPDAGQLERVEQCMRSILPTLERAETIRASIERNGLLIEVPNLAAAVGLANRIAPEHLELAVADPQSLLSLVQHAGAIFLGHYSAEAIGDYCAGPNHVLPTGGTARFSSPLSVVDFQKRSSVLSCTPTAGRVLGPLAARLARGESLTAHARAAELRAGDCKSVDEH